MTSEASATELPDLDLATTPEMAFVLAPGQNLFFAELVAALRSEVAGAGVRSSVHVGNFPPPRPDLVYLLVPPHEYFTLLHGRYGPLPEVLRRTIFICAEQPGTPFFDNNLHLAPLGGAVFDINPFAVREFARKGIAAEHLQLGWTADWDRLAEVDRDVDVLFMGAFTERRARALASFAATLSRYRVEILLSDNTRPNWVQSGSYRSDEAKWDLLRRSKVLLNLHQEDDSPYFEWLRVVQAISNGAAVVSERSVDFAPLVPGDHLLMGDVTALHLLAELLLQDGDRRWRMQTAAYNMLRETLPLAAQVKRLITTASRLAAEEPIREIAHRFFTQPEPDPDELAILRAPQQPASVSRGDDNAAWMRRALKDLRLDMLQLRRDQARRALEASETGFVPQLEMVARTASYPAASPRVSVLTALYNHASSVIGALDSAVRSRDCLYELIIVDDGSSDASLATVRDWMRGHESTPAVLLHHPVNRGLADARNAALGMARGEYCFVLDADNEVYPHCLTRLSAVLDADPALAFAYGMLEAFTGDVSLGLMSTLPWDPQRLRLGNYIDAMALLRTSVIRRFGGYPTDRRLHGWEDYALWCRFGNAELAAVRVPEILARYRVAAHSMLSLTNISSTDAFSVIIEANPRLMAGVEPPD